MLKLVKKDVLNNNKTKLIFSIYILSLIYILKSEKFLISINPNHVYYPIILNRWDTILNRFKHLTFFNFLAKKLLYTPRYTDEDIKDIPRPLQIRLPKRNKRKPQKKLRAKLKLKIKKLKIHQDFKSSLKLFLEFRNRKLIKRNIIKKNLFKIFYSTHSKELVSQLQKFKVNPILRSGINNNFRKNIIRILKNFILKQTYQNISLFSKKKFYFPKRYYRLKRGTFGGFIFKKTHSRYHLITLGAFIMQFNRLFVENKRKLKSLIRHPGDVVRSYKTIKQFFNKYRKRWIYRAKHFKKIKSIRRRLGYVRKKRRIVFYKNRTFTAPRTKWIPRKHIILHPILLSLIAKLLRLGKLAGLKPKPFIINNICHQIFNNPSIITSPLPKYFFLYKRKRSNYYFTVINKSGEVITNYSSGRILTNQKLRRNRKARNAVFSFYPIIKKMAVILKKKKIFNIHAFIKSPSLKHYHLRKIINWLLAYRIRVKAVLLSSSKSHGSPKKNKKVRRL